MVWAVLIAGNRDPEVFTEPDRFDIGRKEAKHCSFGGGIHFCLGSHLARLNAEVAFLAMTQRFSHLKVDESAIEWAPSLFRIPGKIPASFELR
ncbi:cytochrome P450 [Halieaceae bacterium]|nr:cytochrome P450 [Halieaceae bacterium]